MSLGAYAVSITIGMALASVVGDYFLKIASEAQAPFRTAWFPIGVAIYAATAFGWVAVMPHLKLAQIGALYCVAIILALCFMGMLFFKEKLNPKEWLGVFFAIVSVLLLRRVA